MAKFYYSYSISHHDKQTKLIVRNSSIIEELARISYLLTDKTGTLTKNEMEFKKVRTIRESLYDNANFTSF